MDNFKKELKDWMRLVEVSDSWDLGLKKAFFELSHKMFSEVYLKNENQVLKILLEDLLKVTSCKLKNIKLEFSQLVSQK